MHEQIEVFCFGETTQEIAENNTGYSRGCSQATVTRRGQEVAADSPFYHLAALAPHLSSRVVELKGNTERKIILIQGKSSDAPQLISSSVRLFKNQMKIELATIAIICERSWSDLFSPGGLFRSSGISLRG